MNKLKIVIVNPKYCSYLRKYDSKVIYNSGNKINRPFVGVLFEVNQFKYFAPLASPKEKHLKMNNTIDFMKIDRGKMGAINFNNMIPLKDNVYTIINLQRKINSIEELKYQKLLIEQYLWLNAHYIQVCDKAKKLYEFYNKDRLDKKIKQRCCNFKMLEDICTYFEA